MVREISQSIMVRGTRDHEAGECWWIEDRITRSSDAPCLFVARWLSSTVGCLRLWLRISVVHIPPMYHIKKAIPDVAGRYLSTIAAAWICEYPNKVQQ